MSSPSRRVCQKIGFSAPAARCANFTPNAVLPTPGIPVITARCDCSSLPAKYSSSAWRPRKPWMLGSGSGSGMEAGPRAALVVVAGAVSPPERPGGRPSIPATRFRKAASSSRPALKSTQVSRERKAGTSISAGSTPGSRTGTTRRAGSLARISRATRISSLCQELTPDGPRKTATVAAASSACSRLSCQGSPGIKFHLSRKTASWARSSSRAASCSTAFLSRLLWDRNTSYWKSALFMDNRS